MSELVLSQHRVAGKVFKEIWNEERFSVAEELFTDDCLHHFYTCINSDPILGPSGYVWIVESIYRAFSDLKLTYELSSTGDSVQWSVRGIHREELFGVPASHQRLAMAGHDMFRFEGDRIRETWGCWNVKGFLCRVREAAQQRTTVSELG